MYAPKFSLKKQKKIFNLVKPSCSLGSVQGTAHITSLLRIESFV